MPGADEMLRAASSVANSSSQRHGTSHRAKVLELLPACSFKSFTGFSIWCISGALRAGVVADRREDLDERKAMSEQANLQLVQEGYGDFARGDVQALLEKFAEDIEWIVPGSEKNPLAGTYKGRSRVGEFFKKLNELTELGLFEPREFIAQGDKVVALGREEGRVRSTARKFQTDWAMVFTVRDGKIARFHQYLDTSNIEAAFASAQGASA
jgi:uncharacterized protein